MTRPPYPSEAADRFQVRMPDGLRDRIAEAAKASGRSMNAEIVARIEESLAGVDQIKALTAEIEHLRSQMTPEHYQRLWRVALDALDREGYLLQYLDPKQRPKDSTRIIVPPDKEG